MLLMEGKLARYLSSASMIPDDTFNKHIEQLSLMQMCIYFNTTLNFPTSLFSSRLHDQPFNAFIFANVYLEQRDLYASRHPALFKN
jgi:hypothetical protein